MIRPLPALALTSLLLTGAIFGFFYAWVCSTMWGLDAAPPLVAVQAMQAMNASVRNAVFAPAFFGTPVVLALTAGLAWRQHSRSAPWFAAAGIVYALGAFLVTVTQNVPMNLDLAAAGLPANAEEAARLWSSYSPRWQALNQLRTGVSGLSLLLVGGAMMRI